MSYEIKKGKNLRVKVDGKYVACATDCTLSISANVSTLDTDHKDVDESSPAWEVQEVKTKSWSVSVSALYSVATSETNKQSSEALLDLVGNTTELSFDEVTKNGTTQTSTVKYHGSAVCTDAKATGTNGQNASITAEFKGSGVLAKGSGS